MPDDNNADDPIESVIRGLRSERLFFEPEKSSSLMLHQEKGKKSELDAEEGGVVVYKESEALTMESNNPSEDFRSSMEEMVEAHGLIHDWNGLEQLLRCYLQINDQTNHKYIINAFIDLLLNISFLTPSSSSAAAATTTTTTTTSTCISSSSNLTSSTPSPPSLPYSSSSSSSLTTANMSFLLDHDNPA